MTKGQWPTIFIFKWYIQEELTPQVTHFCTRKWDPRGLYSEKAKPSKLPGVSFGKTTSNIFVKYSRDREILENHTIYTHGPVFALPGDTCSHKDTDCPASISQPEKSLDNQWKYFLTEVEPQELNLILSELLGRQLPHADCWRPNKVFSWQLKGTFLYRR